MPPKKMDLDKLVLHVGQAIRSWTSLEFSLFQDLGNFLGVDQFRARMIWQALPNLRNRRELLSSLAETFLSPEQLPEYRALLKRLKSLSEFRHALAHQTFFFDEKKGTYDFANDAAMTEIGAYFGKYQSYQMENIKNLPQDIDKLRMDFEKFRDLASIYTYTRMHREPQNDPILGGGRPSRSTPEVPPPPPEPSRK